MRSTVTPWLAIVALWSGTSWANDSGVVSFQSAGSLQRSVTSEPFALVGASVPLSGELLFPGVQGHSSAVVLAHGCEGNRNIEPVWGPFLRKAGYATFNVDSLRGRALTRSAPSPLRSRRCSVCPTSTARCVRLPRIRKWTRSGWR